MPSANSCASQVNNGVRIDIFSFGTPENHWVSLQGGVGAA